MAKIIFSFDVEDFITPETDNAAKFWADTLSRYGIKGCFCLVGEKARALKSRGRKDVIKAIRKHEVDYHSNTHSIHPTVAEYLEGMDWDEGVEEVKKKELVGIKDTKEIFEQKPVAYCIPGNSWGPQGFYALSQLGIPIITGSPFEFFPGQSMWYCNCLHINYHFAMDKYIPLKNRLVQMKKDFNHLLAKRGKDDFIVIYNHPCRLVTKMFWDEVNFNNGANPPRSKWKPAPLRSSNFIRHLLRDFEDFVQFIVSKENVGIVTYKDLLQIYGEFSETKLPLPELLQLTRNSLSNPNYYQIGNRFVAPAELFSMLSYSLHWFNNKGSLPNQIPIKRLLGPVSKPLSSKRQAALSSRKLLQKFDEVEKDMKRYRRIPSSICIDETNISPGVFMKAMAKLILEISETKSMSSEIALDAVSDCYPSVIEENCFRQLRFNNSWIVFPPDFHGRKLIIMAKLQAWSAKPSKRR